MLYFTKSIPSFWSGLVSEWFLATHFTFPTRPKVYAKQTSFIAMGFTARLVRLIVSRQSTNNSSNGTHQRAFPISHITDMRLCWPDLTLGDDQRDSVWILGFFSKTAWSTASKRLVPDQWDFLGRNGLRQPPRIST